MECGGTLVDVPFFAYDFLSYYAFTQTSNNHFWYFFNTFPSNRTNIVPSLACSNTLYDLIVRANSTNSLTNLGFGAADNGITYDHVAVYDQNTGKPVAFKTQESQQIQFWQLSQSFFAPGSTAPLEIYVSSSPNAPDPIAFWPSPTLTAQLLLDVINGGSSNNGEAASYSTCPCTVPFKALGYNLATGNPICQDSLYQTAVKAISVPIGGVTSTLAPCLNPGNAMNFEGGVDPFFYGNAQLKRIANLDRIRFETISVQEKKCNQSVVFTMIGQSCGSEDQIYACDGPRPEDCFPRDTALEAFMSAQITLFGKPLTPPKFCSDSVFPGNWNTLQWCPQPDVVEDTCFTVKFPNTKLYLSLEVPVKKNQAYPTTVSCVESFSTIFPGDPGYQPAIWPGWPAPWPLCILAGCTASTTRYFAGKELYDYDFSNLDVGVDFSFNGAPTISGLPPEIPPEFVAQLETLAMQVMNTQFRQTIDSILSDKLKNLLAPTIDFLNTLTALSVSSCFNFRDTQSITCLDGQIPVVPPSGCDACDQCCICLTAGDCSQKCQANCPCVRQFCTEVSRGIAPLWVILFVLGVLVVLVATAIAMFGVRGLGPVNFRG